MSDSLNNKELVTVGHQFAKSMSSDKPIMDIAKIVSRLAERLDCTTAALREMTKLRDAMGAENAALKVTIDAVRGVANNSSGISGWNLIGNIATWEEILPEIDFDGCNDFTCDG